jgi:hypothetical protein
MQAGAWFERRVAVRIPVGGWGGGGVAGSTILHRPTHPLLPRPANHIAKIYLWESTLSQDNLHLNYAPIGAEGGGDAPPTPGPMYTQHYTFPGPCC